MSTENLEKERGEKIVGKLGENFDRLEPGEIFRGYEMEVPEEVLEFCKIVNEVGGRVLLVGGCVRDMIMTAENEGGKIKPKDLDMEVYGIQPNDLLRLVDDHFGLEKAGTFGKKFEVIKIYGRGRTFDLDISIPREDNKTGVGTKGFEVSSHPEYTIKEGAKRRDLSCNSVSYDPLNKFVFDPYHGVDDIKKNIIRATDAVKFAEDPVRILRIMQFVARFGGTVEPETEELCRSMIMDIEKMKSQKYRRIIIGGDKKTTEESLELIDKSPIELDNESNVRVYEEFKKLLVKGVRPSAGLEFARRVGIIDRYFPWLAELTITEQDESWHPEGDTWKHTLQAVDAAAEIARRENLNEEDRLTLMLAVLGHDTGKPTKTERKTKMGENGVPKEVITSDGHDEEGGWLSDEFINAFAPRGEAHFAEVLRAKVKVLVEEHMRPKFIYLEQTAGKDTRKMLARLARRLGAGGTNIYLLSLLAEADQRGRNGNGDEPLKREAVSDLEEWQAWINQTSTEYKLFEKLPDKILTGNEVIKKLDIVPGPTVGLLVEWVFDDQMNGMVNNLDEALREAKKYAYLIPMLIQFVEEKKMFARDNQKVRGKNPEDDVLIWLKREGIKEKVLNAMELSNLENIVEENCQRVAELGQWPEYIKAGSLVDRVPKEGGENAPGFDAGVACALDLIPRDKQELAARLHANYSEEAVKQIRRELSENDPDSPTTWWLAACAQCKEGEVDQAEFLRQVEEFKKIVRDPKIRLAMAEQEFEKMKNSFEIRDGVPFGTKDGCMQAAYVAGYPVAVMYAEKYGIYFVGTYLPSLGLDNFEWSLELDENGNAKSGPVYGSRQFVKCANSEELGAVMAKIKSLV